MGVGARIKEELKRQQKTIAWLADATGIPRYSLYTITKRDTTTPRIETMKKIAVALNVPVSYLMGFKENLNIPDVNSAIYDFSNMETKQAIDLLHNFGQLNQTGQEKAVEQVELLTKIPEYQKEPDTKEEPKEDK